MAACELCNLVPTTRWYAVYEHPFRFVIVDCDSCEVPMAVLGAHRARPRHEERAFMQKELAKIADERFPEGWFFDDRMRQIPDHYHVHARPRLRWGLPRRGP